MKKQWKDDTLMRMSCQSNPSRETKIPKRAGSLLLGKSRSKKSIRLKMNRLRDSAKSSANYVHNTYFSSQPEIHKKRRPM